MQEERIFPGAHKIGAAISGPRIADKNFYGHEDFSDENLVTFQSGMLLQWHHNTWGTFADS